MSSDSNILTRKETLKRNIEKLKKRKQEIKELEELENEYNSLKSEFTLFGKIKKMFKGDDFL